MKRKNLEDAQSQVGVSQVGAGNSNLEEEFDSRLIHVPTSERWAFYISAALRDMSYAMMGFLSYFYIEVMQLPAVGLGILLVVQRVWDGIDDPLIGVYFDRRGHLREKAKPFFRRTAIPGALMLMLIFFAPEFTANVAINGVLKCVYAFVTYAIFECLQTASGTAFMSLYNSISPNVDERSTVISVSRLFSTGGNAIVGGIIPILLGFFPADNVEAKKGIYLGMGVLCGVAFFLFSRLMHKKVHERVVVAAEEHPPIWGMFRKFFKNKLLMLMMVSNTVGAIINAGNTSMWFYTYNMGNTALQTVVGIFGVPGTILGSLLVPMLTKRFNKRDLMIGCYLTTILLNIAYMSLGYKSIVIVCLYSFLISFPNSIRGTLYWNMIADTVDYAEWKTGARNDGMIYSIEGFLSKCVGAMGSVSTVIIVKLIGFVENAPQQSARTLDGLFYLPLIISCVGALLSAVPYFFYNFSRKQQQECLDQLRDRKAQRAREQALSEDPK